MIFEAWSFNSGTMSTQLSCFLYWNGRNRVAVRSALNWVFKIWCRTCRFYSGCFASIPPDHFIVCYSTSCVQDGLLAKNIQKEEVFHDHWEQLGSIHHLHPWRRALATSSVRPLILAACCHWVPHHPVLGPITWVALLPFIYHRSN